MPTRELLMDLGLFWEILEYSSGSDPLNGPLFGPSLYVERTRQPVNISSTTALPEPTRLETLNVPQRAVPQREALNRNPDTPATEQNTNTSRQRDDENQSTVGSSAPGRRALGYSDEELAVLADSFFSQRQGFIGQIGEWGDSMVNI
jgi:hypothetical protein